MLNLDQLEAKREEATQDKADLFDFYHHNWDAVMQELRGHQDHKRRQEESAKAILEENSRNLQEAYADES